LSTTALHSRLFRLIISLFVGVSLLSLLLLSLHDQTARAHVVASATPWPVFTPVDDMSDNLLTNPGFEDAPPGNGWGCYGSGCEIDETVAHSGTWSLKLVNDVSTDTHGAYQVITLNQAEPRPLYFSGWSKAECVTGGSDSNYSVYLDVHYADDTWLYRQVLQFDPCSHDWQFREGFVIPSKPIQSVNVYCLLRWTHRGTVWFDDLSVREVQSETMVFDSVPITTTQLISQPDGMTFTLATSDGLTLTLATDGGAITSMMLDGTSVEDPDHAYASGFLVRDVANESDFIHVGGGLAKNGDVITHTSTITALNLDFSATYTATIDRIAIHADVTDTSASERALTLYFALPISATREWIWGDDIRTSRTITGTSEFANFSSEYGGIGANGHLSEYPWASLSGPAGGIALGVPLDSPGAMRLIHNPATNQFYVAFDLGLSPQTAEFPSRAWVDLVLYRFDPGWGFRAAAQGYYDRFPDAFTRRIPPEKEGIWVAFSSLEPITDVQDFGIAFHELGNLDQVPLDEENGIFSFRYLIHPWSQWFPIDSRPLTNPGFEYDPPGSGWDDYSTGYAIDPTGGCCGGRALQLTNTVSTEEHGAWQHIALNQTMSRPLYFGGWSRAESVTGDPDINYSLYLDMYYTDGTPSWGHVLQFDTGTHDWQFREGFIVPTTTAQSVNFHCLLRWTHGGTAWFDDLDLWEIQSESRKVTATISSGLFDECGRYRYEFTVQPWCSGPAGCAVFAVNSDPDISDSDYQLDNAHLVWNQAVKDAYTTTPGLDGEYVDSFLNRATVMDFRTDHFAAADIPLTYGTSDRRVGVLEGFATVEFVRWLVQDMVTIPEIPGWMMANWILRDLWWGADLFDVMGTETNWLTGEGFVPESDATLNYRRTLAYQRPYLLLMNTNFDNLTHELVERYFQICLFYGIYPSMFSHNSFDDPYWEDPTLYNRDRDLFRRYIPLIRRLNVAGWQPVTYASTSDPEVYIERFGEWLDLHFTLRNMTIETKTMTVTLQADDLRLCPIPLTTTALLAETQHPLSAPGPTRTLTVTLPAQASEVLTIRPCRIYLPIILKNG
jgi:hypothetical protein